MKDTYNYFKNSKINFIQQYYLIDLFNEFTLLIEKYNSLINNLYTIEEETNEIIYKLNKIQLKINKIIFKKKANKENIEALFDKSIKIYNDSFFIDKNLLDYLGIKKDKEEDYKQIIKNDLSDNFHYYLIFFSNLNLPNYVKNKLNINNLKILIKIDYKIKTNNLIDEFDNLSNTLYSYLHDGSNLQKYRSELLKRAGVEIITGTLYDIIKKTEEELSNMSEEDKKKLEEYELKKKNEAKEYYLSLKNKLNL